MHQHNVYCCTMQGPIAQMWFFYGNTSSHVGSYIQWFTYIMCMQVSLFASLFLIIRRQVIQVIVST